MSRRLGLGGMIAAAMLTMMLGPTISGSDLRAATTGDPDACAAKVHDAARQGLATGLRCAARAARRQRFDASGCRAKANAAARAGAPSDDCALVVSPSTPRVDACLDTLMALIPDGGRCSAKKLAAARAHLRRSTRKARSSNALCRAFAKAGDCAGDCAAVDATVAQCARAIPGSSNEPIPPGGPVPTPTADERVVAFGAYEPDAIATTSLAGPDGVTGTARIVVAPGAERLFVVLATYENTVWRVEGATDRISRIVLVGFGTQGVTGVPREKVFDGRGGPADVSYWYDVSSAEAVSARRALEDALGRRIDVFGGAYEVGTLLLPDATAQGSERDDDVPPGFDPWLYTLGTFFSPGGVVDVDPGDVVSAGTAEPYEVLPQSFGLAQLVASGAIEDRGEYLYIAGSIPRFPPGLHGAHSVSFVLGAGVPMPLGDPGHSCVISESTGRPLSSDILCGIAPPPSVETCDLPPAGDDEQIVLFGAYEADTIATATVAGQDESTGAARVVIQPGASPLYVVLSAFDPTIWRFEGATSRVRRVVLVGFQPHGVTGIDPARITDATSTVGSLYDARCFAPFYDTQSPEGLTARAAVTAALGRLDAFGGAYEVGSVALPAMTVTASPPAVLPPGFDPQVFEMGTWFNPGGLVTIDPSTVAPSAEPYVILPQAFGLAQLVATGALEYRGGSIVDALFYIARPIPRFPAGLHGAHSVSFLLGRGVPMPAGSPGHSCVISEETGEPVGYEFLCSFRSGD